MTTQSKNVDLMDLEADLDGVKQLTHRVPVLFNDDGSEKAGFIIVGRNSDEYTANQRDIRTQNIQRASNRNKAIDAGTEEGATVVVETLSTNELRTAQAVIVGWYGFGDKEGKELPFDKERADRLIEKFPMWQARIQVNLDNDANFMKV